MIRKCANNRFLLITNIESLEQKLDSNWVPYAVLLTAWSSDSTTFKNLRLLIRLFLARGTISFACLGNYSEQLHDAIDEIIYEYDEEHNTSLATAILTTYHCDESIKDAVNYFIYGTEFPDLENGRLLALVGDNDKEIKEILERA